MEHYSGNGMEMENYSGIGMEDEQMELPPGFRFHPTDEELITHYLCQKYLDTNFNAVAIGEADLNKIEPWDLPKMAKMGEKEWYFFCVRDRKYPTGLRTNRATEAGYWKATGKDKEIYKAKILVGMKKTLVFYTGRAPKGEKTNWVIHEYRLEGENAKFNHTNNSVKNEWVISRVFDKGSGAKKLNDDPGSSSMSQEELKPPSSPSHLPPLLESSPNNNETKVANNANSSHVTCFSDPLNPTTREHDLGSSNPSLSGLFTDQDMADFDFLLEDKGSTMNSTLIGGDMNDYLWGYL